MAYEPIWCIGAFDPATPADIAAMLEVVRDELVERLGEAGASIPLLYGGAVDPGNAQQIVEIRQVDGVLAGRASLSASTFLALVDACPRTPI